MFLSGQPCLIILLSSWISASAATCSQNTSHLGGSTRIRYSWSTLSSDQIVQNSVQAPCVVFMYARRSASAMYMSGPFFISYCASKLYFCRARRMRCRHFGDFCISFLKTGTGQIYRMTKRLPAFVFLFARNVFLCQ